MNASDYAPKARREANSGHRSGETDDRAVAGTSGNLTRVTRTHSSALRWKHRKISTPGSTALAGRPVVADGGYRGNPEVIMPLRKAGTISCPAGKQRGIPA